MAQNLYAIEAARALVAHKALPILPRRPVGAVNLLAAHGVVELQERRAAILRVELIALIAFSIDVVGKAHAEPLRVCRARLWIIAVEDEHVAAAALHQLQEPTGGGTHPRRRHHFEEAIGSDREYHVLKAVLRDAPIAMAGFEAEQSSDERRGGLKMRSREADLAQAQIGPHSSAPLTLGLPAFATLHAAARCARASRIYERPIAQIDRRDLVLLAPV